MDQTAEDEADGKSQARSEPGGERPEEKTMREIAKRQVPAPAPELADAHRRQGAFMSGTASMPRERQRQLRR